MVKQTKKITKETNILELVTEFPGTAEILLDYGMHCIGCIASQFDTLEMGAKAHKLTDEDIKELIDRVNEFIEFGE